MKLVICLSLCAVLAVAVEIKPKGLQRDIKADVLRGNISFYSLTVEFLLSFFVIIRLPRSVLRVDAVPHV